MYNEYTNARQVEANFVTEYLETENFSTFLNYGVYLTAWLNIPAKTLWNANLLHANTKGYRINVRSIPSHEPKHYYHT